MPNEDDVDVLGRTIQRSGEHLIGLIDGLLDLARIEAGRLRLDAAPLPLHDFLDEVVHMVQPQAEAKGLDFRLETRGRVPTWVQSDARRLRQILLNLCSNAVRFTERGQITLRLDARREVLRHLRGARSLSRSHYLPLCAETGAGGSKLSFEFNFDFMATS